MTSRQSGFAKCALVNKCTVLDQCKQSWQASKLHCLSIRYNLVDKSKLMLHLAWWDIVGTLLAAATPTLDCNINFIIINFIKGLAIKVRNVCNWPISLEVAVWNSSSENLWSNSIKYTCELWHCDIFMHRADMTSTVLSQEWPSLQKSDDREEKQTEHHSRYRQNHTGKASPSREVKTQPKQVTGVTISLTENRLIARHNHTSPRATTVTLQKCKPWDLWKENVMC